MRQNLAVLFVLLLAGCQTTGEVMRDRGGNTYPEACRGPVSCEGRFCSLAGRRVLIRTVERASLPAGFIGAYDDYTSSARVASDLTGYERDDAIRHELCHAVAGDWHPNSRIERR